MKKVIFFLALIVSVGTLFAQTKPKTQTQGQNNKKYTSLDSKVDKITGKLKTELILDDDQTTQVRAITLNRVKQVSDAKTSFGEDKKGFNQARKTIFEGWETELQGILTDVQYTSYLATKDLQKKDNIANNDIEEMITQ